MKFLQTGKGKTLEAIIYPLLLLAIMWSVFLIDKHFQLDLYKYGVKPQTVEGLKGILFMPLIHSQDGYSHIISNSIPTFVLLGTLIYFYREISFFVTLLIWLGTGALLWYIATNTQSYHIGMSGVIYGWFGFIFLSGFLKRYLPLQAISLIVAFIYGSMVWGILPIKQGISWQGHLSGLMVGLFLAIIYRKKGPKRPKYAYEIEEEMGIPPPDFETQWNESRKMWEEQNRKSQEATNTSENIQKESSQTEITDSNTTQTSSSMSKDIKIIYHYKPKKIDKP